jgi:Ion channel regulatory protein UNC-93
LASSSVVFSVFGVSSLFVPQVLSNRLRFKWAYVLGFILQFVYVGLNAYPRWYTYMPASALGGLGQAIAFTCSGSAVLNLCLMFSKVTENDSSASQAMFFGVYGVFLEIGSLHKPVYSVFSLFKFQPMVLEVC